MSDNLQSNCIEFGGDELDLCPICVDQLESRVVRLLCGHQYHRECLWDMLNNFSNECAMCRGEIAFNWLHEQGIISRQSNQSYLRQIRYEFGKWPAVGPFIPSHQRLYDKYAEGKALPVPWSRQWADDRKAELRMKCNIPASVFVSNNLLMRCLERGRYGLKAWTPKLSGL